jgi:hypothetical protein
LKKKLRKKTKKLKVRVAFKRISAFLLLDEAISTEDKNPSNYN